MAEQHAGTTIPPVVRRVGLVVAALLGLLVVPIAILALVDWNALREPLARRISAAIDRPVSIEGPLHVRLLSTTPGLAVGRLRVGQPSWAGSGDMFTVERLAASVRLWPLLRGKVVMPLLEIESPRLVLLRDASGRANWQLGRERDGGSGEPLELPIIERLILSDGRLRVRDQPRELVFDGTIVANQSGSPRQPFALTGRGTLNREPFRLQLRGEPLPAARQGEPYGFVAEVRAGRTQATARGTIPRPFDLGALRARLAARGDDLADLHYLTGLALPNTPPYTIEGQVRRDGQRLYVRGAKGRFGDSDLSGDLTLDLAGERPRLVATLTSRRLDLDDLGATFGGSPSTARGETVAPRQRRIARALAADRRLLPDTPLHAERLRGMDGELRYRGESVQAARLPIRAVSLTARLEDGMLTLDPIALELPQGTVTGRARIDASAAEPRSSVDLRVSGLRLEEFFAAAAREGEAPLEGALQARARLQGRGSSVRDAASTADGTVTLVLPSGAVREALAELTGINVARGLGLLLSKDEQQTELRCGVAAFEVRDGVMTAERIVVDTDDVLILGSGNIDLESEATDFRLRGHPKEFRIVRLRAPITLTGPLRRPDIGVQGGQALGQTGLAAALAAVASPLASVLAFVDAGLAEDANCASLLEHAQRAARPGRTAAAPPQHAEPDSGDRPRRR